MVSRLKGLDLICHDALLQTMKTTIVYEENVRSRRYGSFDELLKSVRENALTANYVIDMLLERGCLVARPDGSWHGIPVQTELGSVPTKRGSTPALWSPKWPTRQSIIDILREGDTPFLILVRKLIDAKQPANHWFTVHALKYLMREGTVIKARNGKYALSKAEASGVFVDTSVIDMTADQQKKYDEITAKYGAVLDSVNEVCSIDPQKVKDNLEARGLLRNHTLHSVKVAIAELDNVGAFNLL